MTKEELIKKWDSIGFLEGIDNELGKIVLASYCEKCTIILIKNDGDNIYHKELHGIIFIIIRRLFLREKILTFITIDDIIKDLNETLNTSFYSVKLSFPNLSNDEYISYFIDLYCNNLQNKLIENNFLITNE